MCRSCWLRGSHTHGASIRPCHIILFFFFFAACCFVTTGHSKATPTHTFFTAGRMGGGGSKKGAAPANGDAGQADQGVEIGTFSGKYLGSVAVSVPTGQAVCNDAVKRTLALKQPEKSVVLRIATAGLFIIDADTNDVLKEVATSDISFVAADASGGNIISFFENEQELRLITCHSFKVSKDSHLIPVCINESFKILSGQIPPPEPGKGKIGRRMSIKDAKAVTNARKAIVKGDLLETFSCEYLGSTEVDAPKGDDVLLGAMATVLGSKPTPKSAVLRIYVNVFAVSDFTGAELASCHIRDVSSAKLSADSKNFCFIMSDRVLKTNEAHVLNLPPLEEGRPSIRRSIDSAQKKNAALSAEAAAEKPAEEDKKPDNEAETGKIMGVFEVIHLGTVVVEQSKGTETAEDAYELVKKQKLPKQGVFIQLSSEAVKVMDGLTHDIIDTKVLKNVLFSAVIGEKSNIFTYITKDEELQINHCAIYQCAVGDMATQITQTFGEVFKTMAEELKRLGANPFQGVGERIVPPPDLFSIQIHRQDLKADKIIGAGAFGQVYLASQNVEGRPVKRAVKMLRGGASEADRKIFIKETQFMRHLDHANLVKLVGVAMQQKPWLMVLEYCQYGDLRGILLGCKSRQMELTYAEMVNFSAQVAAGMAFIASKNCIHMDLAARNCLVANFSVVKVADFGLSRQLDEGAKVWRSDQVLRLPIKWTALESLDDRVFSEKSDVWSFGILAWEIAK